MDGRRLASFRSSIKLGRDHEPRCLVLLSVAWCQLVLLLAPASACTREVRESPCSQWQGFTCTTATACAQPSHAPSATLSMRHYVEERRLRQ